MGVCISRSSTVQQTVGKDNLLNDENLVNGFTLVLKNAREEHSKKHSSKKTKENPPRIDELDPTQEVHHPDFDDHVELLELAYPDWPSLTKELQQAKQASRESNETKKNKRQIWKHESLSNNVAQEPKYSPPECSMGENVYVRHMPNPEHPTKRLIVCISDMHLDSRWSRLIDERLNQFMIKLSSIAEQKVNTFVLLGNIVEMWLTPLNETPPTLEENMKRWSAHPGLGTFVHVVRKMAEEDDVKVFYLRGSHDHDLDTKAVETLFGGKVEFIEGTLIYTITVTNQEYRIRFTHGHDWDLFNTYSATDNEDILYSKPFGYYVTRALETTRSCYCDTQQVLSDVTLKILKGASPDLRGSDIVELLSQRVFQMSFLRLLLEKALKRNVAEEDYILMDGGKWIRLENILKYRLFERAIAQFGARRTFSLLTGVVGTFDDFLEQCSEDVAVLGHTHTWDSCVVSKRNGEIIYVNTGSWIDYKEEVCFSKIIPPKEGEDGMVEICYNGEELVQQDAIVR